MKMLNSRNLTLSVGLSLIIALGAVSCMKVKAPTDAPLPEEAPLVSLFTSCSQVSGACLEVDLSGAEHSISPLLFGDGMEWTGFGNGIMKPDKTYQTSGEFRADVMRALKDVGFTLMRYPGGTLADLFHWKEATGPISTRKAQSTLSVDTTGTPIKELPHFGPDEFVEASRQLEVEAILTVNIGTGTAQEAAEWVKDWKDKNVNFKYVEVGNEMYLSGPGNSFPVMDPKVYAQKFDSYARAIRAVNPSLKLGIIGTGDTSFWCYPNCPKATWNEVVLRTMTEKADFMAIHTAYAPGTRTDSPATAQRMLAYPHFIKFSTDVIIQDLDFHASSKNKGIPVAITEHASFYLPPPSDKLEEVIAGVRRNWQLSSALFSAMSYQAFIKTPRVAIANHINPLSHLWQAPICLEAPDLSTFPYDWDSKPTLSIFGYIFKAYRELAGQKFVPTQTFRIPTIDTEAEEIMPPQKNVPLLDSLSAIQGAVASEYKAWSFVVNRSLDQTMEVVLVVKNIPSGATRLVVDRLSSSDYTSKNMPGQLPAVSFEEVFNKRLPTGGQVGVSVTIPKHSLYRFRFK